MCLKPQELHRSWVIGLMSEQRLQKIILFCHSLSMTILKDIQEEAEHVSENKNNMTLVLGHYDSIPACKILWFKKKHSDSKSVMLLQDYPDHHDLSQFPSVDSLPLSSLEPGYHQG